MARIPEICTTKSETKPIFSKYFTSPVFYNVGIKESGCLSYLKIGGNHNE